MGKAQKNINILFVFLFSAYAIYSVIYLHSSLFFIIYLFWFDEVIRNLSMLVQIRFHKSWPSEENERTRKKAISAIKGRFLFLFIYAVLIIIVYGIFFHLDKNDQADLRTNARIIVFHDIGFNSCIMIAMVREIIQIRLVALKPYAKLPPFATMNGHLLTLHFAIIFGGILWAITSNKFELIAFDLGTANKYIIALPFFVAKCWVDIRQIQQHN